MSISVVIPAYNSEKYLKETLESVLGQTMPPHEVLVIDDGSTDSTADVADEFGPRVTVFRRPNSKAAASRNFGVQQATGEWIAFSDADDVWESDKLEKQMAALAATPGADFCYTGRRLLMQNGDTAELGKKVKVPPADGIREELFRHVVFLPSSVVIKRSTFLAVGGFDPSFRYVEDWDLWMRLLFHGAVFAACQEPLVRYRVHADSTTQSVIASSDEAKEVYRRHILPKLPRSSARRAHRSFLSDHETYWAFLLRSQGDPRCIAMMAASIVHRPFYYFLRYKVLAHMIYSRLRGRLSGPKK